MAVFPVPWLSAASQTSMLLFMSFLKWCNMEMVVPSESSFLSAALLGSKLVCLLASLLLLAHTCLVLRWLPALLTICADRATRAVRIFHQQLFHHFSMLMRPKHYSKTWNRVTPCIFFPSSKNQIRLDLFPYTVLFQPCVNPAFLGFWVMNCWTARAQLITLQ